VGLEETLFKALSRLTIIFPHHYNNDLVPAYFYSRGATSKSAQAGVDQKLAAQI